MNYNALIKDNNSQFDLNPNKKNVMYIDFNNLFMRSYFIAKKENLNPIDVLLKSTYALKTNIDHHYAFAIADGKTHTQSRLEIYPEYKANREEKTPEEKIEISNLKKISNEMMDILGICYHETSYIEADDVIGILSTRSINQGWNVIVVSSDKDYKQLCHFDNLNIYNSMKKTVTTSKNMVEQNGLNAMQYLDYLILTGDSSDNITGVNKIGDVTAKKLLNEFGSINNMMISLVREGLIDKKDYLTPQKVQSLDDSQLLNLHYLLDQPLQENEQKLKQGVVKNNLIQAIKDGKIELNRQLIGFQYQHENIALIPKEKIKKPTIDSEKLLEFCQKYNLNQFINYYIYPNGYQKNNNHYNQENQQNYQKRTYYKP